MKFVSDSFLKIPVAPGRRGRRGRVPECAIVALDFQRYQSGLRQAAQVVTSPEDVIADERDLAGAEEFDPAIDEKEDRLTIVAVVDLVVVDGDPAGVRGIGQQDSSCRIGDPRGIGPGMSKVAAEVPVPGETAGRTAIPRDFLLQRGVKDSSLHHLPRPIRGEVRTVFLIGVGQIPEYIDPGVVASKEVARQGAPAVRLVLLCQDPDLAHVGDGGRGLSLADHAAEYRECQCYQDRDDGDRYQQLDKRESGCRG